ncbi:DUF3365 domain-containing protein [bacterium]|nr:DUF3365 domain-containing protein [bacterium]MBU1994153.1 DUF3365 domain-containing protein [bacterium]
MGFRKHFINKIFFMSIVSWSVVMLLVALTFVFENYGYAGALAKNEAFISINKDLAYRSWGASHGGVYVPITETTPPNPYLAHLKNRDVNTTDNQRLTLMNGAYMLSQMMSKYSSLYGNKGHITSKKLLNPNNKPDAWEDKALDIIEKTRKPFYEKSLIGNEEYFRYLNPLITETSCLKCHQHQGYKVGDIRGAVSVSIPMSKYYKDAFSHSVLNCAVIGFIWLIGMGVILYSRKKIKEAFENKIKDYEQHLFSLVNVIEKRDSYTAGHTQRVAKYSVLIAKEMGFNEEKIDELYRACMLHDIGKVSTPDSILLKPGKLSELEYKIIQEHVVVSYELLKEVDVYKDIAEIVHYHHERYDGSGYPHGLKADEIPLLSQIMTVADAFDAMTTNRIYKAKKSVRLAILELQELASKQFNAQIVNAAGKVLKNVVLEEAISQRPLSTLEKERFSYFYKDQVTGVYNKNYLEFVMAYNYTDEFRFKCGYGIYLKNFTQYNKKYSWEEGDKLLKQLGSTLDDACKESFIFRLYGDDFIMLSKKHIEIEKYINILQSILVNTNIDLVYKHIEIDNPEIADIKALEVLL